MEPKYRSNVCRHDVQANRLFFFPLRNPNKIFNYYKSLM